MGGDGSCPKCGRLVDNSDIHGRVTSKNLDLKALAHEGGTEEKVPWHFKLLVGMLVVYLTWRIVQLFS